MTVFFNTFDEYLKVYPKAEHWRKMVKKGVLIAGNWQSCLDGNYLIVYIRQMNAFAKLPNGKTNFRTKTDEIITHVVIHNGDDWYYSKQVPDKQSGEKEIEDIKILAPLNDNDLIALGFTTE